MKITGSAVVDNLAQLFRQYESHWYMGEPLTITQHMLQAAHFAKRANADDEEIAAALLHDIGHYLSNETEQSLHEGRNNRHESVAANFLQEFFPPSVTEPIRLHVDAKRYLCATDRDYLRRLSDASIESLQVQGGPLTSEEVKQFEANPHHQSAVRLRYRDDAGKNPDLEVSDFESYRPLLERLAK